MSRRWNPVESVVLALLAAQPAYGYEIGQLLSESGFGEVKGGTLYPLLRRLEEAGYLRGEWRVSDDGPSRKYYEVTPAGLEELTRRRALWLTLRQAVDEALGVVT